MSSVSVTITGILWDHANKSGKPVTLVGDAYLSGLGVGGGPIIPDQPPPSTGGPPGQPTFPIWGPPGFAPPGAGYPPGIWGGPIVPVPPSAPNIPPPGSPPIMIGTSPVQPIPPPPAVVIEYPGIGKVVVPQPTQSGPAPQ